MKEDTYRLLNRIYKIFAIPTILFVIIALFDKRFDIIWIPLYMFTVTCAYVPLMHYERDSKAVWFWRIAFIVATLMIVMYIAINYLGV